MLNAKLVVVGGDAKAAEITLTLPTTIGRGREVTLTLPHPLVSRQHCELFEKDGLLQVRDLESLNGTYVDSQRIDGISELRPDHLLTIGNVTFRAIYDVGANHSPATVLKPQGDKLISGRPGQVIDITATVLTESNGKAGSGADSIRDRKTTPGKQSPGESRPDPARSPGDPSSDVLDEPPSDTPLSDVAADSRPQYSVCAAMRDAGVAATTGPRPESLSEIQRLLPGIAPPAAASSIEGLAAGQPGALDTDHDFRGIEADGNTPAPLDADESALGSFIRKLPR